MKCLSLRQPWASLLVAGVKQWETRSWKPSPRNLKIIQREGLLIHASATKKDAWRMGAAPFSNYLTQLGTLPYGAIIGRIKIGRIITTANWLTEFRPVVWPEEKASPEYDFGDYGEGRLCWEILEPESISHIPWRGALSLWEFAFTDEEKMAQAIRDYGQPWENSW